MAWTAPPAVAPLQFWWDRVPLPRHNAEFPKTQRSRFQWCSTGFRGCQLPSSIHCGTLMVWWSSEDAVVAPPHQSSTPSISQDLILEQASMELWIDAGGSWNCIIHAQAFLPLGRHYGYVTLTSLRRYDFMPACASDSGYRRVTPPTGLELRHSILFMRCGSDQLVLPHPPRWALTVGASPFYGKLQRQENRPLATKHPQEIPPYRSLLRMKRRWSVRIDCLEVGCVRSSVC